LCVDPLRYFVARALRAAREASEPSRRSLVVSHFSSASNARSRPGQPIQRRPPSVAEEPGQNWGRNVIPSPVCYRILNHAKEAAVGSAQPGECSSVAADFPACPIFFDRFRLLSD
jgi:hypothetical protein